MAYFIEPRDPDSQHRLSYLPIFGTVKDSIPVSLDWYDPKTDEETLFKLLKYIVNEEGDSYPQDKMDTIEQFRNFYSTHDVFVCRLKQTNSIAGAFYVKPNFPGRCSHICNGGFIVEPKYRGSGIGTFMAKKYLFIARSLGYKASFFNLVFVSNEAAVALWRKLGFREIGVVPKAGNLKGKGYTDAIQFYYDLESLSADCSE